VRYARFGVMPNWNERLSEAEIRSVALYVHSLGGGE
jgi:cytochrome c oxidase cbb3-type subunit 3